MENLSLNKTQMTPQEAAVKWKEFLTEPLNIPKKLLKLNTLWWGAENIINSIFTHRRVAVQSGHSLSKDWSAGVIVIAWLLKYFDNAKVICTAPTGRQVEEIMFGEIAKQFNRLCEVAPEFKHKGHLTQTKLEFGPECFALGLTTKDTKETVGKFQGFKSPNLLIIISEAQAVEGTVYKQIRGLMTSPNSRILELGNPLVPFGTFYEHCTNPRFDYKVIKMSCFDSPNVVEGREIIPGLVTSQFIENMRRDLGEEDPEWQSRVLGEFPQESAHAWIPLAKIKAAVDRVIHDNDNLKVGGLDTARMGEDETVHCVLLGRRQVKQDAFRKVLTPETVGWARGLIEDEKLKGIAIDEGYNPGVSDWLTDEHLPVLGINFGASSPDERFENFGTYMWFMLRQAFMDDQISIINDPVLVAQLAYRKVLMTPKGKRRLESKGKSGQPSPDRADALAMAWYMRLSILGDDHLIASPSEEDNEATQMHEMLTYATGGTRRKVDSEASEVSTQTGNLESDQIRY